MVPVPDIAMRPGNGIELVVDEHLPGISIPGLSKILFFE
jgi:hypothetical protein